MSRRGAPPVLAVLGGRREGASIAPYPSSLNGALRVVLWMKIRPFCREFPSFHTAVHRCGRRRRRCSAEKTATSQEQRFRTLPAKRRLWKTWRRSGPSILAAPRSLSEQTRRETHLPTERSPPEAASRVPSADVHPRRPRDPQAAARAWAQAALRLRRAQCSAVIGSPGRRTSTPSTAAAARRRPATSSCTGSRVTTIPTASPGSASPFPRSVGSAVARNRVKRLLRESWRELLPTVPAGQDYVLAARPGLAEPADARGKDWLVTEIADVLERARA